MSAKISTTASVFDIRNLFKSPSGEMQSVSKALSGRFAMPLVQTKDYELSLVTYVSCKEAGCPESGFEYVVNFFGDGDTVHQFDSVDDAVRFINAFMLKSLGMTKVSFTLNDIPRSDYTWKRDGMNGATAKMHFTELKVTIHEVSAWSEGKYEGYVKNDDVKTLIDNFGGVFS